MHVPFGSRLDENTDGLEDLDVFLLERKSGGVAEECYAATTNYPKNRDISR